MAESAVPDLILRNGVFTTLDRMNPMASAVAVKDGRFLRVGDDAGVVPLAGPGTTVINLQGRRVLPGLRDNHTHIIRGGLNFNMELRWDAVRSLADAMGVLKRQVAVTPPPQWVRVVGGFTEHQFAEKRLPTEQGPVVEVEKEHRRVGRHRVELLDGRPGCCWPSRWPWRMHATYDETITRALDVFEKVNRDIPLAGLNRFFDHAETISEKSIDRIAALGGGVAVQHRMAYQGEYFVERYGAAAAQATPPVARMIAKGVNVSAGTDATRVASYNPWVSLAWLVTGVTVRWLALLAPCAAYLQGGLNKAFDFEGAVAVAVAEMQHFGVAPAAPLAVLTIVVEIGASLLILTGIYRWAGALILGGFTLFATFVANRFWEMAPPERFMAANSFFEHIGLIGGFVLVAWHDLRQREVERT